MDPTPSPTHHYESSNRKVRAEYLLPRGSAAWFMSLDAALSKYEA